MLKNNITILLFGIIAGFLFSPPAFAATMFFSSPSTSYNSGEVVRADVLINTKSISINAVEAAIKFPTDILEVVSISKTNSIFSLWVQDPSFSNSNGTITFSGGVPNPGFTGVAGKIISIVFHTKKTGTAYLAFSSSSILANDGLGTEVNENPGSLNIVVNDTPTPAVQIKTVDSKILPAVVSSSTHPDSNKWYNTGDVKLSWVNQQGITGASIYLTKRPDSIPSSVSDGLFSEHSYKDLEDGIWYFHIRLTNGDSWSQTTHFKINIDTKKPDILEVSELSQENNNQKTKFKIIAQDSGSGISNNYLVSIDGNKEEFWGDTGDHIYETPAISAGNHQLVVKAFDAAGNYTTSNVEFTINQATTPVINTSNTVNNSPKTNQSNMDYVVMATSFIDGVGPQIISVMSILIPLMALVIVSIFILYYGLSRLKVFKEQLKKEFDSIEKGQDRALSEINKEIKEIVDMLEKVSIERHLTHEEKKVIKVFRKNLDKLNKFKRIKREMKKLNKLK